MLYKNKKTGAVLDTAHKINGKDWVPVDEKMKKSNSVNDFNDEELDDEELDEDEEEPEETKPVRRNRKKSGE